MKNADFLIEKLQLTPHPEGGYFKEIFKSTDLIQAELLPQKYSGSRVMYTSIYFLLKSNQVSHFHRLKSDELWSFHFGSSLIIHVLDKNGKFMSTFPSTFGFGIVYVTAAKWLRGIDKFTHRKKNIAELLRKAGFTNIDFINHLWMQSVNGFTQ